MECMQCGAQWVVRDSQAKMTSCPFCGKPLTTGKAAAVYTDFIEAMKAVVQMKGTDFLINEPEKVLKVFLNITEGLQKEYQLLKLFYHNETHKLLEDCWDLSEEQFDEAARSLRENMFMDPNSAKYIVDVFAFLFGKKEESEFSYTADSEGGEEWGDQQSTKEKCEIEPVNDSQKELSQSVAEEITVPQLQDGMIFAEQLEIGLLVELDNAVYQVIEFQQVRPGRGTAFVRAKFQNVNSGGVVEKTFKLQETLVKWNAKMVARTSAERESTEAIVSKREMQYLLKDGNEYYFMDLETYEQLILKQEIVGEALKFVKENEICKICSRNGSVLHVEPPLFVSLLVTDTAPAFKGDTATGSTKPAIVETGAQIAVPMFVGQGDMIKIDTRTGEYLCRDNPSNDNGSSTYTRTESKITEKVDIVEKADIDDEPVVNEEKNLQTTKYTEWFDLSRKPNYQKSMEGDGDKKRIPIRIPIGVSEQGELHYIEFGGMKFAGYLMGSSGSGKSSLIHTMIASILYNYHPDDVELWLVDFKMMEFAKYIEDMPPHVKYIVLDYSPKVVCDLLDKISAELVRRTELFAKHPEWRGNIENVPVSAGLPRIFLLIDEFEKMAKILTNHAANVDVSTYKKKISSLLQEGRSAGFYVLFSSQNYEAGVNILEENARNNIGIRIAMKNEKPEEVYAVLNIKGQSMEYKNKVEYLEPHQVLIVEKDYRATKTILHLLNSLWFSDDRDIKRLQINLGKYFIPVRHKQENNLRYYFYKKPNVINGKQLNSFEQLNEQYDELTKANRGDVYLEEDIPVYWGNLQSMDNRKPVWLTTERGQNICLVAPQNYAPYAASVVLSTIKCFKRVGTDIMIIGYGRNLIYSKYRSCWKNFRCTDEMLEADRWLDGVVASIMNKSCKPLLIILCGAREIVEEVISEKAEQNANSYKRNSVNEKEKIVGSENAVDNSTVGKPVMIGSSDDWEAIKKQSASQVKKNMGEVRANFATGLKMNQIPSTLTSSKDDSVRDIWDNIGYIQQFGSKRGVHLMTVVGSVQDIDSRSKISPDHYEHLLSFKLPSYGTVTRLREAKSIGGGDDYADDSICLYNGREVFTFRPFLHKEITWGDWQICADGSTIKEEILEGEKNG